MLKPCCVLTLTLTCVSAMAAAAGPEPATVPTPVTTPEQRVVTVTGEGASTQSVVIEGTLVNRASGPGAVAITNIGGQRRVVRGNHSGSPPPRQRVSQPPAQGPLRDLDLAGRQLAGSDWSARQLTNVDLSGADLRGARLAGAALTDVDLSGADLRGADLQGAQLINVAVGGIRLRGARMMDGRVCQTERCL